MKEKVKKLYFTNDFSIANVQKLQAEGWIIRNAQLAQSDSFIEQADEYGGEVPEPYKAKVEKITVQLGVKTSPELQKVLADTKAECEKVVAENGALQGQLKKAIEDLETERAVHVVFMDDVDAMQTRIDELKSAAANPDPSAEQSSEAPKEMELLKSTENEFASWTIPQIKDYLAAKEIGFKASASKDELLALIPKE